MELKITFPTTVNTSQRSREAWTVHVRALTVPEKQLLRSGI